MRLAFRAQGLEPSVPPEALIGLGAESRTEEARVSRNKRAVQSGRSRECRGREEDR
jgi:hypothetical protein